MTIAPWRKRRPSSRFRSSTWAGNGSRRCLTLLGLRHDSQIWLGGLPSVRIFLSSLFIGDGGHDDDIFPLLPIHRGGDFVCRRELDMKSAPVDPELDARGKTPGSGLLQVPG